MQTIQFSPMRQRFHRG